MNCKKDYEDELKSFSKPFWQILVPQKTSGIHIRNQLEVRYRGGELSFLQIKKIKKYKSK